MNDLAVVEKILGKSYRVSIEEPMPSTLRPNEVTVEILSIFIEVSSIKDTVLVYVILFLL